MYNNISFLDKQFNKKDTQFTNRLLISLDVDDSVLLVMAIGSVRLGVVMLMSVML